MGCELAGQKIREKKLNQTQNQIFRSLSPQFPPTVIARLKYSPHPSSHPLFEGSGSRGVLLQLASAPNVGGMQLSL